MSKTMAALLLLSACAADDAAGSGDDILPKRGELAGDPTIVSATASCEGVVHLPSEPDLAIRVHASDPKGEANLDACAVSVALATKSDTFVEGCRVAFGSVACNAGESYTVGITISNKTGGVTTASVTLTVED